MSLTSYRAAPPRAIRFLPFGIIPLFLPFPSNCEAIVSCKGRPANKWVGFEGVPYWFRAFACYEKIVLRFADLAATYSPAS